MSPWPFRVLLVALLFCSGAARADGIADWNGQLADVLAQYRDAVFQSAPSQNAAPATIEALNAFVIGWDRLAERWSAAPPPHYRESQADFAHDLAGIKHIGHLAYRQAQVGSVAQAHATLGEIRALLAEMRRRNGLQSYADELEAFDDRLAEEGDSLFDDATLPPEQIVLLIQQSAVLAYLGERLEKRAPAALADDANFLEMIEELNRQIRGLDAAVQAGQRDPIMAALADLRRLFDRICLLYG